MIDTGNEKWDEFHDPEIVDWKRVRSSIEHENLLTNHRLTWLLSSQGILLAAFALVYQASFKAGENPINLGLVHIVLAVLAFTGILISLYLWVGLRAAYIQHNRLRDWWNNRPETVCVRHPSICGQESGWQKYFPSHGFPFVFVSAWLFLIPVALWEFCRPYAGPVAFILLLLTGVAVIFFLGVIFGPRIRKGLNQKVPS
jgi:hypothetical protein